MKKMRFLEPVLKENIGGVGKKVKTCLSFEITIMKGANDDVWIVEVYLCLVVALALISVVTDL